MITIKIILYPAIFLIVASLSYAIVSIEHVNGVDIKIYNEKIRNDSINILNEIPTEYLEDINMIKFMNNRRFCQNKNGRYYVQTKTVAVCDNSINTLIHEISHNIQIRWGDMKEEAINHIGWFGYIEQEIHNSINAKNITLRNYVVEEVYDFCDYYGLNEIECITYLRETIENNEKL